MVQNNIEEAVHYFSEDTDYKFGQNTLALRGIEKILTDHSVEPGDINIIFCSDEYLLRMNREYLDHDYFTDILTFPINTHPLSGDLFISVDRVKDFAKSHNINFGDEILRVIFHGVLHLVGYDDKSKKDKVLMRSKEDEYLRLALSL